MSGNIMIEVFKMWLHPESYGLEPFGLGGELQIYIYFMINPYIYHMSPVTFLNW